MCAWVKYNEKKMSMSIAAFSFDHFRPLIGTIYFYAHINHFPTRCMPFPAFFQTLFSVYFHFLAGSAATLHILFLLVLTHGSMIRWVRGRGHSWSPVQGWRCIKKNPAPGHFFDSLRIIVLQQSCL